MGMCGICGKQLESTTEKYCPKGCNSKIEYSRKEWGKFHFGKKRNSMRRMCRSGCLSLDDIECTALKFDIPIELVFGVDRCECRKCHEEN